MAVSLTRFSVWAWGGKEKEPSLPNGFSSGLSTEKGLGFRDQPDTLKFPFLKERKKKKIASSSKKARQKWRSREQRIDKEFDVVLVPADGVCLSESESEDSDWSIGWLEPHGPNFLSDDDEEEEGKADNNFAVLVPCYRPKSKEMNGDSNLNFLTAFEKLQDVFSSEANGDNYIEQWLSSLQNY